MKLSKSTIGIIAAVVIVVMWAASAYNSMVGEQEKATTAFANVQSAYQRRADLIPNLVDCVKQYDKHEYETLIGVVEARRGEGYSDVKDIKTAIAAVAEAYPDLKSQKNYQELMNELAITENKIADFRKFYNKNVTDYKRFVRQFPNKQILGLRGYEVKDYERLEFENTSVDAPKNLFE